MKTFIECDWDQMNVRVLRSEVENTVEKAHHRGDRTLSPADISRRVLLRKTSGFAAADNGSPELRLALSLALQVGPRERGKLDYANTVRRHFLPLDNRGHFQAGAICCW